MLKIPSVVEGIKNPLLDHVTEAMSQVVGDINQFIDQVNEALGTLRSLGLSVEMMSMKVVPPQADIQVTGALEDIDQGKAKELIKGKENNPYLSLTLQALRVIASLKKPLSEVGFKGVKLERRLGLPPKMDFTFLK